MISADDFKEAASKYELEQLQELPEEPEIMIDVPLSGEESNWPHDGNIGDPMAEFFLKYGIIDHEILVHTHPSEDFNCAFHIPLPGEAPA